MNPLAELANSFNDNPDEQFDPRIYESDSSPRDKRENYRYPVMNGQEVAMLRRRGVLCEATLLEESSGGYRVLAPIDFRVQPEERIQIGTNAGWFEVRVAHLQVDTNAVTLGLERTGIVATSQPRRNCGENIVLPNTGSQFGSFIAALFFLIVGLAVLYCAAFVVTGGKPAMLLPQSDSAQSSENSYRFDQELPPRPTAKLYASMTLLEQPAVAERLNLSEQQRKQIDRELTRSSLQLTDAHEELYDASPEQWSVESQAIVANMVETVVPLLTDQQINQWRSLLMKAEQNASHDETSSVKS